MWNSWARCVWWLDLLAVQETLKSLLQYHSSKASILWCSDCFMVQLSHPYVTTGETIALTKRTFVSQVMSLVFNTLSRLVLIWPAYPSSLILQNSSYKFGSRCSKFPTASPSQDHIRILDVVFMITSLSGELLFILSDSLKKSLYQASSAHYPLFVFPWYTVCLFTVAFILSCFNFLWYFSLH